MCASDVYLETDGETELLMRHALWLVPEEGGVYLRSTEGEEKTVDARVKRIDFEEHRVVLEPLG